MRDNIKTIERVVREIHDAFKDVSCPKDEDILIKGMAKAEYCGNKTAGLSGVKWINFPTHCYSHKNDFYTWPWLKDLTPVAYHYFLPGYLIIVVQYYDKCHVDEVVESLLLRGDYLIPQYSDKLRQTLAVERRKKYDLFSLEQQQVVKLFLEYLIAEHSDDINNWDPRCSPQAALMQYWGNRQSLNGDRKTEQ